MFGEPPSPQPVSFLLPGAGRWRALLRPGGYLVIHEMAWLQPDPPGEMERLVPPLSEA